MPGPRGRERGRFAGAGQHRSAQDVERARRKSCCANWPSRNTPNVTPAPQELFREGARVFRRTMIQAMAEVCDMSKEQDDRSNERNDAAVGSGRSDRGRRGARGQRERNRQAARRLGGRQRSRAARPGRIGKLPQAGPSRAGRRAPLRHACRCCAICCRCSTTSIARSRPPKNARQRRPAGRREDGRAESARAVLAQHHCTADRGPAPAVRPGLSRGHLAAAHAPTIRRTP